MGQLSCLMMWASGSGASSADPSTRKLNMTGASIAPGDMPAATGILSKECSAPRPFGEHAYAPIIDERHIRANRAAMFEPYQEIAQLETNLVEINLLVSRQTARIERLAEKGGDTTQAMAVLRGLKEVLEYFRAQQRKILDTLEQG
jgi:hypothetical protein